MSTAKERWESPRCGTPKNTAIDILTQLYEEEAGWLGGSAVFQGFSMGFFWLLVARRKERGFTVDRMNVCTVCCYWIEVTWQSKHLEMYK